MKSNSEFLEEAHYIGSIRIYAESRELILHTNNTFLISHILRVIDAAKHPVPLPPS